MTTYEQVVTRVSAVATVLHRTLLVVAVMLAVAALGLVVGIGAAGDWGGPALVLGAVLGGLVALMAVVVVRFLLDVAKIRRLPSVSREELQAAATQVAATARTGEQRFMEARGLRRLLRLAQALRAVKADVETLGEGGLAPAVALGQAMVPARILLVGACALAAPFLLALGLLVLVAGLVLG